jgi:hypothetical protein
MYNSRGQRMLSPDWKARVERYAPWVSRVPDPLVRKAMAREVDRVAGLAESGQFYDDDSSPIPPMELAGYRAELRMWGDYRGVLRRLLLNSRHEFEMGPATHERAIDVLLLRLPLDECPICGGPVGPDKVLN